MPHAEKTADVRHDNAPDLEQPRDLGDVQAGGAAEGHEHELARVDAAPYGDDLDALRHVGVDDLRDALGDRDGARAELFGDARDGRSRRGWGTGGFPPRGSKTPCAPR
jgi:hypothetical protein